LGPDPLSMTTLTKQFTLGEPQVAGPLAIFPIFGPEPRLEYRVFEHAVELGAFVKELDGGAAVGDLLIQNPTDQPLLVYEGEEVLGAQQNRTFDVSVLVAVGAAVMAPVSCVERGRWDYGRAAEPFQPAPQTADPAMRRAKRLAANSRAGAGLESRADQGEVWSMVDSRLAAEGVASASSAMSDVYDARRSSLDEIAGGVCAEAGQVGAVAQAGRRLLALDLVSRPGAFERLLPRLAQGYALDALGGRAVEPDFCGAAALLAAALGSPRWSLHAPGMGAGFRFSASELVGSGLEHDGELVQLCAFPGEGGGVAGRGTGSIVRPTRRRRR
jgi:hypothetical protein